MDKRILLKMGIPITIKKGYDHAIIELNQNEFVVVTRFQPRYDETGNESYKKDSVYLKDFDLNGWVIFNPIKRLIYWVNSLYIKRGDKNTELINLKQLN